MKLPVRASVLWLCAVLLGVAAGRTLVKWRESRETDSNFAPSQYGFQSQSDMDRLLKLSEAPHLNSLSQADFNLLLKYASAKRPASTEVCAALESVSSEAEANACLSVAKEVYGAGLNAKGMGFVVAKWNQMGFLRETQQLEAMEKGSEDRQ